MHQLLDKERKPLERCITHTCPCSSNIFSVILFSSPVFKWKNVVMLHFVIISSKTYQISDPADVEIQYKKPKINKPVLKGRFGVKQYLQILFIVCSSLLNGWSLPLRVMTKGLKKHRQVFGKPLSDWQADTHLNCLDASSKQVKQRLQIILQRLFDSRSDGEHEKEL